MDGWMEEAQKDVTLLGVWGETVKVRLLAVCVDVFSFFAFLIRAVVDYDDDDGSDGGQPILPPLL